MNQNPGCRDTLGRLGCNVQGAIDDEEVPSPFRENALPLAESANPASQDHNREGNGGQGPDVSDCKGGRGGDLHPAREL